MVEEQLVIALGVAQDAANHGVLCGDHVLACKRRLIAARNIDPEAYFTYHIWVEELRRELARVRRAA
ncbi:MAG: hypothetical protein ACTHMU_05805 [Thermomicrobiales bacterium]